MLILCALKSNQTPLPTKKYNMLMPTSFKIKFKHLKISDNETIYLEYDSFQYGVKHYFIVYYRDNVPVAVQDLGRWMTLDYEKSIGYQSLLWLRDKISKEKHYYRSELWHRKHREKHHDIVTGRKVFC